MSKVAKVFYIVVFVLLINAFNVHCQFQTEKINFKSANPFSLSDIITNLDNQEEQKVFGKLTIPVDSLNPNKKYPLVIGVAGSLGWRKHHLDYMKIYQKLGIATFELNSFKSRGISSTVGSQDEVTIAAITLDAYRALEVLSKHPKINKDKVAITGWSLGGGVTLFSGWTPLRNAINPELEFAARSTPIPLTVSCISQFHPLWSVLLNISQSGANPVVIL